MPRAAYGRGLPPPPSGAMSLPEISSVIASRSWALPQSLLPLCSGVGSREKRCLYSSLSPSGWRLNTV
jgi:hypothetical protein